MAHMLEAQGQALRTGVTGEWNKFLIKARKADIEGVTQAVLVAFDGPSKPIIKFQYKPNQVTVLYKPLVSGEYKLEISKSGEPINGSPFQCTVKGTTEIKPDRIKVQGAEVNGKVNTVNEVSMDYTEANISAKLKVSMEGPTFPMLKYGKPEIRVIEVSEALKKIQYTPKFAGKYKLHLGFEDGTKVPGSPFPVVVE